MLIIDTSEKLLFVIKASEIFEQFGHQKYHYIHLTGSAIFTPSFLSLSKPPKSLNSFDHQKYHYTLLTTGFPAFVSRFNTFRILLQKFQLIGEVDFLEASAFSTHSAPYIFFFISCCHVSTTKIKSSRNTKIDLGTLKNLGAPQQACSH